MHVSSTTLRLVPILGLVVLCACGTAAAPLSSASPASLMAGAPSCAADEAQDLTLSGAVTGHVKCSTSAATCIYGYGLPTDPDRSGVALPLNARVGSIPVQLYIAFHKDTLGEFAAGPLGDNESFSSSQGVTLDGIGHWVTPANGGSMTLVADDATSASGALDVKLMSGSQTIAVKGVWRCVKPPGF
jgi:hypothetical protein